MQLCRASEEGGDSVPSFSAAVEAALMAVQLLIDACAEDARVAVAVIAGGGARVAAALAVRSWDIMERVTVAAVGGREGEDGREDRGVQAHCGMVVSGLALLANLVRNDEGLKAGLRELELNVKCPAAVSGECACLVQCCALSRILNLFKGAIHDDASPIPKSVSVILCALIGCLVSDNVDNANFVRTLTDGFVSFAEMAALLESFAQFQCEASAAAAGLDAGQMRYVTEGGEKDVEREERGILRQMDCLKGLAGVLRGLEG
ncbi:hypothetical protein BC830DRAFT_17569 [Chytriomyces sp. MP71]|nr:hypothetical protein BC830DRAFT_17569 [Chytriomyces sp. MP71]